MSSNFDSSALHLPVRRLGQLDYMPVWQAMQTYTLQRNKDTIDEIWLVEHPPVYTLGMGCKSQDVRQPNDIPIIKTDRGGQITYHGPGQIVAYILVDLRRQQWGIKRLVGEMEQIVIDLLADKKIAANRHKGAPGVYVDGKKIAALGLRVRRGCSYHGLALNIDMNLEPFTRIDPCGYPDLEATQLSDLGVHTGIGEIGTTLAQSLAVKLGYNNCNFTDEIPGLINNA